MAYSNHRKDKPMFRHALVQGVLFLAVAVFLSSGYAWDLMAQFSTNMLNMAGVKADYVSPLYLIYVKLLDGTVAGFQVLIECSGLLTLAIFSFISIFTMGLLRGPLRTKLAWFALSVAVGLLWNLNRLAFVIAVAYNFGLSAFTFAHYLLAPSVDFLWIVLMWAVGMSWLRRRVYEQP